MQSLTILAAQNDQTVLLYPGGASYDLFVDYEQRGTLFTALVQHYLNQHAQKLDVHAQAVLCNEKKNIA